MSKNSIGWTEREKLRKLQDHIVSGLFKVDTAKEILKKAEHELEQAQELIKEIMSDALD